MFPNFFRIFSCKYLVQMAFYVRTNRQRKSAMVNAIMDTGVFRRLYRQQLFCDRYQRIDICHAYQADRNRHTAAALMMIAMELLYAGMYSFGELLRNSHPIVPDNLNYFSQSFIEYFTFQFFNAFLYKMFMEFLKCFNIRNLFIFAVVFIEPCTSNFIVLFWKIGFCVLPPAILIG